MKKTVRLGKIDGGRSRVTEDAMVGWHHQLNGHEFIQLPKRPPPQASGSRLRVPGAHLPVSWGPASRSTGGERQGARDPSVPAPLRPHMCQGTERGAPAHPKVLVSGPGKPGRLGPPLTTRHPQRSGGQGGPGLLGPEAPVSPWHPGRQALVSPVLDTS